MGQAYHFIGIGGIGMSGLAKILLNRQQKVSGSDIAKNYTIEGLIQAGAKVYQGHSADYILPSMTVIYSSDIKPDNPEYQAAIRLGCPLWHRSDLLAHLIQGYQSFAVAGTHGKTTTTALLATVCMTAGISPSFAVGGMMPEFRSNAHLGEGNTFVFEADESDRTFLKYFPQGAIVTNIDSDHLNAYEGKESRLIEAFQQFMSQVRHSDQLFWCGDDEHLRRLNHPGKTYGFGQHCDWRLLRFEQHGFKCWIEIAGEGRIFREIELNLTGSHNALNALAVFALTCTMGIEESSIRQAFSQFKGIMRRCEKKGDVQGVLFLDDYAHHPTEIEVTLKAIRQAIGHRRLLAVFQPHRYSRTQDCLGTYGTIFESVDEVILTDIYAAGEAPILGVSSQAIGKEIKDCSSAAFRYVPRSDLVPQIARLAQTGDVVVTLGAGDVTKVGPEVMTLMNTLVMS